MASLDIICGGLIVLSALFFMVAEKVWPYNAGQKLLRKDFWSDMFAYNFIQSFILGVIISWIILGLDRYFGFSGLGILRKWPVWVQVGVLLLVHDFYIYAFHRLQHRSPALWRLHEAHHSTPDIDWLSGVRSHPLEILINQTIEFAPMIFLGASPEVPVIKGAISAIWGMFIHSNLSWSLGRPLKYIINGPELHRWHHAKEDPRAMNRNFGTKFAFWDFLFGTAFLPEKERSVSYGLDYFFPDGYWRQTFFAFRTEGGPNSAERERQELEPFTNSQDPEATV
jgi:sterol desaturase/sphingolipid hydroxylase (fatty acid hydroxylase superfamily)